MVNLSGGGLPCFGFAFVRAALVFCLTWVRRGVFFSKTFPFRHCVPTVNQMAQRGTCSTPTPPWRQLFDIAVWDRWALLQFRGIVGRSRRAVVLRRAQLCLLDFANSVHLCSLYLTRLREGALDLHL